MLILLFHSKCQCNHNDSPTPYYPPVFPLLSSCTATKTTVPPLSDEHTVSVMNSRFCYTQSERQTIAKPTPYHPPVFPLFSFCTATIARGPPLSDEHTVCCTDLYRDRNRFQPLPYHYCHLPSSPLGWLQDNPRELDN